VLPRNEPWLYRSLCHEFTLLPPTLQGLLALVGATATVVFSYLFPSLLVLRGRGAASWQRVGAAALLALGGAMSLTAVYDHLAGRGLE
jgi:hypothetical protein